MKMEIRTWLVNQCISKKRADKDETETETETETDQVVGL